MIVSHEKQIVFLHNPKVAGTSIRTSLEMLHDEPETFWGWDKDRGHDKAHIGMDEVAKLYPDLWSKIKSYNFFSLRRNPATRFFSSLSEYSKNFAEVNIFYATPALRRQYLFEMIDRLSQFKTAEGMSGENYKWAHFKPQWIYWRSDEHDIACTNYDLGELEAFLSAIEDKAGVTFDRHDMNKQRETKNYPAVLKGFLNHKTLRAAVSKLVRFFKLHGFLSEKLGQDSDALYEVTRDEYNRIVTFIQNFYAKDFALWPDQSANDMNVKKYFKIIEG